MIVASLVAELRRRGVRLAIEGDQVRLHVPLGELTGEDLAALRDTKPALLDVLRAEADRDREVARRLAAMAPRVPARGPVPFLRATAAAAAAPGGCPSCGEPFPKEAELRCPPCVEAARRAVAAAREGGPE